MNEGILCNLSDGGEISSRQNRDKFKVKIDRISLEDEQDYITYNSLKEVCEYNNINSKGNIVSCCIGKILYSEGYIWQYSDENKRNEFSETRQKLLYKYKIIQHIKNSLDKIFNSVKEAAMYNNVSDTMRHI